MKKRLCLTVALFILMPYSHLAAQVFDISQLEKLQELQELQEQQDATSNVSSLIENKDQNERPKQRKDKELLENEVENFGYTGRRDFIISPQPKTLSKSLKYFGYDFFVDTPTTFAPAAEIPIPPDYILGPGDEIKIILFGNKNKQYTLKVTRDGDIFFPEIGPISVAGLTFLDLKENIQQIIDSQIIGTKVSITLGILRSINIFVLGEAFQPGMYTVSSLSTLTNAIFVSGGIRTTGSLRKIEVKRKGQVLSTFDFYNLLLKGDTSDDTRLMTGDVVFIPPITKTVGIAGEVERPGIYELKEGETAEDLISFAGTLKPKADLTSVEIERIDSIGNGFNLTDIDLNQSSFSDLYLNNGDILTIYPVVNRMNKVILVSGHAQKPGFYPWKKGIKILDVFTSVEDLLPMTDMNYVLINRKNKVDQSHQTLQVDLEALFSKKETNNNKVLEEGDEIIFFPSLLTPDLIKTTLIEDGYDNQQEKDSLIFVVKSIRETTKDLTSTPVTIAQLSEKDLANRQATATFQYTIHDYCTLPGDYVARILGLQDEEGGRLKDVVDKEITHYCRNELLAPVVALLEQQGTIDDNQKIIDVYGNIAFPGRYPLSVNATLEDALKASGGLRDAAFIDEIEVISREYSGKEITTSILTSSYKGKLEPIFLRSLDVITVKTLPDNSRTVSINGEVFFPGEYPITPNETMLSLIKRAGGLKDTASVRAAFFQRESLRELELKRLRQLQGEARRSIILSQQSQSAGQESNINLAELEMILSQNFDDSDLLGRLVINLDSILKGTGENIILEDGDELTIPKHRQSISVIGEVYVPNAHIFQKNLSVEDYINMSGGPTKFADVDNRYVIKVDGSITLLSTSNNRFFRSEANALETGDTIVQPLKLDQYSTLRATSEITQIIYQMALATAAVKSF